MELLSTESFAAMMALVGVVIVVAALLSGYIERSSFPQVAVFLALGAALGPQGLGLLNVGLDSPILRVVATLSLTLVLFTDAVSLSIREARKYSGLALLVLGPGTLSSAALISLLAWWLLRLPPAAAVILGAALASTDPVLLRGLLRRPDVPREGRIALRLESGLNDVILLPVVLIAMIFLRPGGAEGEAVSWGKLLLDLFLLGPAAGVLVGLLGVATLDLVRRRIGVRRDYESLYSLGIAFAAFAAAEAVHGSGFLAAFMAGLTVAALDVELCDCFLEYGETTGEMALLFTFVLLGASLIWSGLALLTVASLAFALATIFIRPVTFLLTLAATRIDRKSRFLIAWFGPRGLSSLLLVLLPVFAGVPQSERIFSYCCLVVVFSVAVHGGTLMALNRWKDRHNNGDGPQDGAPAAEPPVAIPAAAVVANAAGGGPAAAPEDEDVGEADESGVPAEADRERITVAELRRLWDSGEPVVVVDARSERTFLASDEEAVGAVRVDPNRPVQDAQEKGIPKEAWAALFCT